MRKGHPEAQWIGGNGVALLMPVWKRQQYLTLSTEVNQQERLGSRAGAGLYRALNPSTRGHWAWQGRAALAHESGSLIGSLQPAEFGVHKCKKVGFEM